MVDGPGGYAGENEAVRRKYADRKTINETYLMNLELNNQK